MGRRHINFSGAAAQAQRPVHRAHLVVRVAVLLVVVEELPPEILAAAGVSESTNGRTRNPTSDVQRHAHAPGLREQPHTHVPVLVVEEGGADEVSWHEIGAVETEPGVSEAIGVLLVLARAEVVADAVPVAVPPVLVAAPQIHGLKVRIAGVARCRGLARADAVPAAVPVLVAKIQHDHLALIAAPQVHVLEVRIAGVARCRGLPHAEDVADAVPVAVPVLVAQL